jgi:hypothetical protein
MLLRSGLTVINAKTQRCKDANGIEAEMRSIKSLGLLIDLPLIDDF